MTQPRSAKDDFAADHALTQAVAQIRKQYGPGAIMRLGDRTATRAPVPIRRGGGGAYTLAQSPVTFRPWRRTVAAVRRDAFCPWAKPRILSAPWP
jgi:hypothetical protein